MSALRERGTILAIDIGATSIKFALVDEEGRLVGEVSRAPTPFPCSPERLIGFVTGLIADSGAARVGLGFPGDLREGRVVEPGNLARPGGFTSPVDPELDEQWRDLDLTRALRDAADVDVRVVNDATLAALGCAVGSGRELVFTLGTGFGIALVVEGRAVPIRDVGAEVFWEGETYDRALGDHARRQDESRWLANLVRAVNGFAEEFEPDVVHLGGGNAWRVDQELFRGSAFRVAQVDNLVALIGAARLFRDR